jgi:hypothetical protein
MIAALRYLLVCLPLLGLSGCSWFPYIVHNVGGEIIETTGCCHLHLKACALADREWKALCSEHPDGSYSPAYAHGFHDGFVDYVEHNGLAEPPAIPPVCYRYPSLRTPAQQQKIEDWFAGFRHGAQSALAQGWRDGVIVPISRPPITPVVTFSQEVIPTPSADPPSKIQYEELPPPKGPPPKPAPITPAVAPSVIPTFGRLPSDSQPAPALTVASDRMTPAPNGSAVLASPMLMPPAEPARKPWQ